MQDYKLIKKIVHTVKDTGSYLRIAGVEKYRGLKNNKSYLFQRTSLVLVAILWAVVAFNVLLGGFKTAKKELIISAFSETIYSDLSANISTCARCKDIAVSDNVKEIILREIADKIGINQYEIIRNEEEIALEQTSVNGEVKCKFKDNYIIIDIKIKDAIETAFEYEKIVRNIVKELNLSGEVTLNIHGDIKGKADLTAKNMLTDLLLDRIDAKVVLENRTDELYTVYAYDKDMDNFVQMGDKKININISMSYDETKDVTNVYFSTPINNEDY